MAIIIDVLEDKIIPGNLQLNIPASRSIQYTARENGGTMYYWVRGGLDAEADLQTLINSMAQELFDDAEANGTPIPDIITWVYIEKRRKPVYRDAWAVVRNEVGDTGITNEAPNWDYQFHILQQLATNTPLAQNFQANAWRMGLIPNKDTQISRAVINGMTALQRGFLYLLTLSFMGLGYTVGVDGSFILDEHLNQSGS